MAAEPFVGGMSNEIMNGNDRFNSKPEVLHKQIYFLKCLKPAKMHLYFKVRNAEEEIFKGYMMVFEFFKKGSHILKMFKAFGHDTEIILSIRRHLPGGM